MLSRFRNYLFTEVSIYSLIFTRIIFGLLMFYQMLDYVSSPARKIYYSFIFDRFHFKYYGFEWVEALPGNGMYYLFYAMLALSVLITVGLFYRIAIILFTIGFCYIFLIDQALYLNHYYMVILYSTLLCLSPANRYFSIDALIRPKISTTKIAFWPIFILRTQTEIILIYAGLVKINYDWLHLIPLKYWLAEGSSISLLDHLFRQKYSAFIGAYGVIALHIFGAPLLLWRKTRLWIFLVYCVFHIINSLAFKIGIFPWMTIAVTLIFFDPNWPVKLLNIKEKIIENRLPPAGNFKKNLIMAFIILWTIKQILLPIRNLLYPGYVFWTQEGQDFSWRMKVQEVEESGNFVIVSKSANQAWFYKYQGTMICDPDMILYFSHYLRDEWKKKGHDDVQVFARILCSLNRRKPQLLINPHTDLAKEKQGFKHKKWILPFDPRIR